jgi:hypothetical protein
MSTVEEIERAIEQLPPQEWSRLSRWFAERDNALWDHQMAEDSASRKLDFLFKEAAEERKAGQLRDWPSTQS